MKHLRTTKIDGHEIIWDVVRPSIDPVATAKAIKKKGLKLTPENRRDLMKEHAVYFTHRDSLPATDSEAAQVETLLESAAIEKKLVLKNKTLIADKRGVRAWQKADGQETRNATVDLSPDLIEVESPNPYSKWDKNKWVDDAPRKAEFLAAKAAADRAALISERVWKNAEAELIAEGKIAEK